jgi:hypothetical protein
MLAVNSSQTVFLGIDPTTGRSTFTYASLDAERAILALGSGKLSNVLAYAAGQSHAVVAVNGPSGVNKGLAEWEETNKRLFPEPEGSGWANLRLAEAELIERGMDTTRTPGRQEDCPHWMRVGFELYEHLGRLRYVPFPAEDSDRQWLEVNCTAGFSSLSGSSLFDLRILEGRMQRQLILNIEGLPLKDPLEFFEEVTRHRLLRGILPYEMIYSGHELNAIMAAYTAWLALNQPERAVTLGGKDEGLLVLPVKGEDQRVENRE